MFVKIFELLYTKFLFKANLLYVIFSYLFCILSVAPAYMKVIRPSSRLPDNFLHPTGDARVTMGSGTPLFIRRTLLSIAFKEIARNTTCNRAVMTEQCTNIRKGNRWSKEMRSSGIVRKFLIVKKIIIFNQNCVSSPTSGIVRTADARGRDVDSGPIYSKKCARARPYSLSPSGTGNWGPVRRFRARCARLAGYIASNRRTSGPHLAPYPLSRFSRLLLLISSHLAAACLVL